MSVYLELLHGRKSPDEQPPGWGTDGPVIGPFEWVHTTYARHVRGGRDGDAIVEFFLVEDLIHYDGVYYGDWSVISSEKAEGTPALKARIQEPKEEAANA